MDYARLQELLTSHGVGSCDFCRIVRGADPDAEILFRLPGSVGFLPLKPAALGHVLVAPDDHFTRLWEMPEAAAVAIAKVLPFVARAIVEVTGAPGLSVIQSNGAAATQTVDHVHFHLVPRWVHDGLGPFWPEDTSPAASTDIDSLEAFGHALRQAFSR